MQRKMKVLVAAWLAKYMEKRARRLRRALRDYERAELRKIHAADRRARGLRLYTAWFRPERVRRNHSSFVPLQATNDLATQPTDRRAA
jgi:hypothetical protein